MANFDQSNESQKIPKVEKVYLRVLVEQIHSIRVYPTPSANRNVIRKIA